MIPPKSIETLQLKLSSQSVLEWISQKFHEGVNPTYLTISNFETCCILFHVKDYFENHFFLGYIQKFLNVLKNPHKNIVWLYVMKKGFIARIQTPTLQNYQQVEYFKKLVLSVFERTEIEILNQVSGTLYNKNTENLPLGLIEDISKLGNFLSDPSFKERNFSRISLVEKSKILIGSVHFINYIYEIFFKGFSRDIETFSPQFLLTLRVLKSRSTVKLLNSTLHQLYCFFNVHKEHTLGLRENDYQKRSLFYLEKMEDHYKENFDDLVKEVNNEPKI